MSHYVILCGRTGQGVAGYRETLDRAGAAATVAERHGGAMTDVHWTLGTYDLVATFDFPDDETATAVALLISAGGNIRTTTMRAFDRREMVAIIAKTT